MKHTIQAVIRTLNQIKVSGSENLNYLLGSIQALEGVLKELDKPTEDKDDGRQANQ